MDTEHIINRKMVFQEIYKHCARSNAGKHLPVLNREFHIVNEPIVIADVSKLLTLDCNKGLGTDDIHSRIARDLTNIIYPSLTFFSN